MSKSSVPIGTPYGTTRRVVTHVESGSMDSRLGFLRSENYTCAVADMRALGCTDQSAEVWDFSPVAPEPL